MKILFKLPFNWLLFIGRRLGDILYIVARKRRNIAKINIDLVFPELSTKERKKLLHKNFQSLGMWPIETAYAWYADKSKIKNLGTVHGLENLQNTDQGAILMFYHSMCFEIGCAILILAAKQPISGLYKQQSNKTINNAMIKGRKRFMADVISKKNIRGMIKVLKNNQKVLYAIDQHASGQDAIFVDFFNIPAATKTTTSRLAEITKAKIIPISIVRDKNNRYNITIHPHLPDFGTDITKDTQATMKFVEQEVAKNPEQYLWTHRRFKTQPNSTNNYYEL